MFDDKGPNDAIDSEIRGFGSLNGWNVVFFYNIGNKVVMLKDVFNATLSKNYTVFVHLSNIIFLFDFDLKKSFNINNHNICVFSFVRFKNIL